MFPPSNDDLPSFSRCCQKCHLERLMDRLESPDCKFCHACNGYAGRWVDEQEKKRPGLILCYLCEASPQFANYYRCGITYSDEYRSRPRSIVFGSSSYQNTSSVWFQILPKRRHSMARKDLDEREQKRDKWRHRDPRQILHVFFDPEIEERESRFPFRRYKTHN